MCPSQPVGEHGFAGSNHPQVRRYLQLKRRRGGDHSTVVALEGASLLERALTARVRLECVFACTALLRGEQARFILREVDELGVPTLVVSERLFRRMVDRDGPDGIAALAHLPPYILQDVKLPDVARVVVTV